MPDNRGAGPSPAVEAFFDPVSNTVSYIVHDPATGNAAIVDPVLDFDHSSGRLTTASADHLLERLADQDLRLLYILETHAHADHLSAGHYLRMKTGAELAIGEKIADVQTVFAPIFDAEDVACDGAAFDRLLADGESLQLGNCEIRVLHTPGHTPACICYHIGDAIFVGDTLFMPDFGTARCDFPGGDAAELYSSIQKILALPDETRVFTCHDYLPNGREEYRWESSIADQRQSNIHVGAGKAEVDFIAMRRERDSQLAAPKLILPSLQVNIRAGTLPPAEASGKVFLRLPVNAFPGFEKTSDALQAKVEDFQPDWHI